MPGRRERRPWGQSCVRAKGRFGKGCQTGTALPRSPTEVASLAGARPEHPQSCRCAIEPESTYRVADRYLRPARRARMVTQPALTRLPSNPVKTRVDEKPTVTLSPSAGWWRGLNSMPHCF